jgi:hypothetical protein
MINEDATHQQENDDIQFELFKRQKNELIKALKDYDPNTKFKYERDPKDVDAFRKNPFFMFYPGEWEISPRQISGVHFSFYVRGEHARLSVGVESPIRDQYKEKFKREVVEELKRCEVELSEFDIWPHAGQTKRKAKLLEVIFPFDNYSCQKAIGYYQKLEPFIAIVSEKIKAFKKNGYVK